MQASSTEKGVELEAALAAIQWKHTFGWHLRREATRIAESAGERVISLKHYHQAVPAAIQSTLSAILAAPREEQETGGKKVA
jgi:hypothetical protein